MRPKTLKRPLVRKHDEGVLAFNARKRSQLAAERLEEVREHLRTARTYLPPEFSICIASLAEAVEVLAVEVESIRKEYR